MAHSPRRKPAAKTDKPEAIAKQIDLPDLGKNVHVRFKFSDLEALEKDIGVGWFEKTLIGLGQHSIAMTRKVGAIGLHNAEVDQVLGEQEFPLEKLAHHLGDALMRTVKGMTFDQAVKKKQEEMNAARAQREIADWFASKQIEGYAAAFAAIDKQIDANAEAEAE